MCDSDHVELALAEVGVEARSQGGVRVGGQGEATAIWRSHQITGAASHQAPEPPETPEVNLVLGQLI